MNIDNTITIDKIKTVFKEIGYSISKEIILDKKETLIPEDRQLLNEFVEPMLDTMVSNAFTKNLQNGLKVSIKPHSILHTIDFSTVEENVYKPAVSDIHSELIDKLKRRLIREVNFYKNDVVPELKRYKLTVENYIKNLHNDVENSFNYVYMQDRDIYPELINKLYFDDTGIKLENRISFSKPIDFSILKEELTTSTFSDINLLLNDLIEGSVGFNYIVDRFNTVVETDNANLFIDKITSLNRVKDLDLLMLLVVSIRNYLNKNPKLDQMSLLAYKASLQSAIDGFSRLYRILKARLKSKKIILDYEKFEDETYLIYIDADLTQEAMNNYNVTFNTIAGALLYYINRELPTNLGVQLDFEKDKTLYDETYKRFHSYKTMKMREGDKEALINIYIKAIYTIDDDFLRNTEAPSKEQLANSTANFLRNSSLHNLLDVERTSLKIFGLIVLPNTNFYLFSNSLKTAYKVMGDDTTLNEAIIYGTLDILINYLINQLSFHN